MFLVIRPKKQDPAPEPEAPPAASSIPPHGEFNHPQQPSTDPASACPVDPKTREIWLRQAQQIKKSPSQGEARSGAQTTHPSLPASHPPLPKPTTISSQECSSDRISQDPTVETHSGYQAARPLSHGRVVSSIPRAFSQSTQEPSQTPPTTSPTHTNTNTSISTNIPANSESETGASASGNWIYPSEHQFFHAVMRKQTLSSSNPTDLATSISAIIPIHNAVNEQAWVLIKRWEKGTSDACGGPRLLSFQGLGAGAKSPKARWNSLWGYTEPFDRHDWVVQRCDGSKVEYVIDFYQARPSKARTQSKEITL
ncbi:hypothetical protein CLAIMM_02842 [Cladophialophora immunda]|nr:hypothetical protein CLAIMM_02842 [Cladophialophora immunda]